MPNQAYEEQAARFNVCQAGFDEMWMGHIAGEAINVKCDRLNDHPGPHVRIAPSYQIIWADRPKSS